MIYFLFFILLFFKCFFSIGAICGENTGIDSHGYFIVCNKLSNSINLLFQRYSEIHLVFLLRKAFFKIV